MSATDERQQQRRLDAVLCGLTLAALWVFYELSHGVWIVTDAAAPRIHGEVIGGTAAYPHQYRVLVPFVCEALHRVGLPLRLAYLLQRYVAWALSALVLRRFLERWLSREVAFAGALVLVAVLPFSCIGSGHQPTDPLCLLSFVLAYDLLLTRRDKWLYAMVGVGMLNRETVILIALLAAAVRWDERGTPGYWRLVAGLGVLGLLIYAALHLGYGPRESFTDLVSPLVNVPANLSRPGSLRLVVLFGAVWWLALAGLKEQPAWLRRSAVLVPVFLVVHLCVGLLGETRYFLPLAPTVLALGLRRLFPEAAREPEPCG